MKRGKRRGTTTVRDHVWFYGSTSLVSNKATIAISDAGVGSATINAMAELYRLYRFTRLDFRIVGIAGGSAGDVITAVYLPAVGSTAPGPTTSESRYLAVAGPFTSTSEQAVPGSAAAFTVPWSVLKGAHEWYETQGDASANGLDNVGQLFLGSTIGATTAVHWIMRIDFEFMAPADPAIIALALRHEKAREQEAAKEADKKKLLRELCPSTSSGCGSCRLDGCCGGQ